MAKAQVREVHSPPPATHMHRPPPSNMVKQQLRPRALVIAPFDMAGDVVHSTVCAALEDLGLEVFHFDNIEPGSSWVNAITDAIHASDLIVADITQQNLNVFYELGYAHALKKPTILIKDARSKADLPSDLLSLQYIVYDTDNLLDLVRLLERSASRYLR